MPLTATRAGIASRENGVQKDMEAFFYSAKPS